MNKQAPTVGRLLTMVVFALSCFGLLLFLWLAFGGPIPLKPKGYQFKVAVPEANQLAVEADVRIAGVPVGRVKAKEQVAGGNKTLVTVQLERKYAPVDMDSRVVLRTKTLLGEKYLEMTRGRPGGPKIPEGGRLADARVDETVELDEVLGILDAPTRRLFRIWQQDSGAAVADRGGDLNDAFGSLPQFAATGTDLLQQLDAQEKAVGQLIRNTGQTFEAITEDEGQLRNLVVNQDDVFGAIASEREAFAETFRVFPTFLDESRATARDLESFSRETRPLLRDLRPAFQDLRPTLGDVRALAPDLRDFYRDLDPLITVSQEGLPALRDTLNGLTPVLGQLQPFLEQLNPILEWLEYHQHSTADFLANGGGALVDTQPDQRFPEETGHFLTQFGAGGEESFSALMENRGEDFRGNAYPDPTMVTGTEQERRMIIANWDCSNTGRGEFTTQKRDSNDAPSCWVKRLPGPTRFPHIKAAEYGK